MCHREEWKGGYVERLQWHGGHPGFTEGQNTHSSTQLSMDAQLTVHSTQYSTLVFATMKTS